MKRCLILIPVLLMGCSTYRSVTSDGYAMYMDNVTAEMSEPSYWLRGTGNPDRVLLTSDEIASRYGTPDAEFDSLAAAGTADGRHVIRAMSYPYAKRLYDASGNVIDSSIWKRAAANRNPEGVGSSVTVRYGIVTGNIEMRTSPTMTRGYQDSDNAWFDDLVMTHMLTGEQVLILHESADGQWYLALNRYAPVAWIRKDDVALCRNRAEWEKSADGDFLMVTADRIRLEMDSPDGDDFKEVTMGTRLKLIRPDSVTSERHARNAYAVLMPERRTDGCLEYRTVFLPAGRGVHVGLLPYTRRNVLELAFSCLGDRYGWGGMFGARDCSAFMMDIYRCFGMTFPRNSGQQARMDCRTLQFEGLSPAEKLGLLRKEATPGSLLHFPGHIFMYLGQRNGHAYTINSLSSISPDGHKTYIQSVAVNTLDEKRANGKTWLECLSECKIIEK